MALTYRPLTDQLLQSRQKQGSGVSTFGFLALLLVFFVMVVSPIKLEAQSVKLGDLDGDGQVTVLDMIQLLNHLNGSLLLNTNQLSFADANQDSIVNRDDIAPLQQAILGLITLAPKDTDNDGVPDAVETLLGLDPKKADSNNNGVPDGDEDFDGDGLKNKWEILWGYDPRKRDTDGNGIADNLEDPDFDGLNNLREQTLGTNPYNADTDGDGLDDATEVLVGTNPLVRDASTRFSVSSRAVGFLNATLESLPTNTVVAVASRPVSFLNALNDTLPNQFVLPVTSLQVSYINAISDVIPSQTQLSVAAPQVSFLNAIPDPLPAQTRLSASSLQVSYLNGIMESAPTNTTATSRIVSYRNTLP